MRVRSRIRSFVRMSFVSLEDILRSDSGRSTVEVAVLGCWISCVVDSSTFVDDGASVGWSLIEVEALGAGKSSVSDGKADRKR